MAGDCGRLGRTRHRGGVYAARGPKHSARSSIRKMRSRGRRECLAQAALHSPAGGVVGVRLFPEALDGENRAKRGGDCEHGQRWESKPARQIAVRREDGSAHFDIGNRMNYSVTILAMAVVALGLGLLLLDLWAPLERKRQLGYAAAAALGLVLLFSFSSLVDSGTPATAFKGMYVQDALALFFKRLFLVATILVL